jgi:hypothetical protein
VILLSADCYSRGVVLGRYYLRRGGIGLGQEDDRNAEIESRAGELELVGQDGTTVTCEMVLMSDWKTGVHRTLAER